MKLNRITFNFTTFLVKQKTKTVPKQYQNAERWLSISWGVGKNANHKLKNIERDRQIIIIIISYIR